MTAIRSAGVPAPADTVSATSPARRFRGRWQPATDARVPPLRACAALDRQSSHPPVASACCEASAPSWPRALAISGRAP